MESMDSNNRSTYDIVYSCAATLVICVWVVFHSEPEAANLTEQEKGFWTRCSPFIASNYDRKPLGPVVSLIFPELMILRALKDWLVAKKNILIMRNIYEGIINLYLCIQLRRLMQYL